MIYAWLYLNTIYKSEDCLKTIVIFFINDSEHIRIICVTKDQTYWCTDFQFFLLIYYYILDLNLMTLLLYN